MVFLLGGESLQSTRRKNNLVSFRASICKHFFFFLKLASQIKVRTKTIFNCSLLRIETYNVNAIRFV